MLDDLLWETLCHPKTGNPLFVDGRFCFYRSSNQCTHLATRRNETTWRAAFALSLPDNLEEYGLEAPTRHGEMVHVRNCLGTLQSEYCHMASPDDILKELQQGTNLIYLHCHITVRMQGAWLWLEDGKGEVSPVRSQELAEQDPDDECSARLFHHCQLP